MPEQRYLRIALAVSALVCCLHFFFSREAIDLVAAALFVLVTYSTSQSRSGAFLGAAGASAAMLAIRVHQYAMGAVPVSVLLVLNVVFPAVALVLALLARGRLNKGK